MKLLNINIPGEFALALIVLALSLPMIFIAISNKWDGHLWPQEKCWQLQEISGQVYKVNTCTGEVELLKPGVAEQKPSNSTRPGNP